MAQALIELETNPIFEILPRANIQIDNFLKPITSKENEVTTVIVDNENLNTLNINTDEVPISSSLNCPSEST